jgi:serine/threonine-protein kinase
VETICDLPPQRTDADAALRTARWRAAALAPPAGAPRLLAVSWSLPGERPARRTAAPGDPTLALPGLSGDARPLPAADLLAAWPRFADLELAGIGGMGRVYRARDRRDGRIVAVKLLIERRYADDELREARLQARVDHPAVLPVLDHGRLAGFPWFSMPYVGGAPLKAARRGLGLGEAIALLCEVCRAVAAVHRRGIVHCDVNPRNILVDRGPAGLRAWLIDFGIAGEPRRGRSQPRPFGTPAYMAPEQVGTNAAELDPRTDVYGLGATLYEIAAGRHPFPAATCEAVLTRTLYDEPEPLSEIAPDVPRALDPVVRRCLAKEPADRYPGAADLAADLERLIAN